MRTPGPITPHGGVLVDRIAPVDEREALRARAAGLPKVTCDEWIRSDLELLSVGVLSPVEGFMGREDYESVVSETRLKSGVVFGLPVTLRLPPAEARALSVGGEIALVDDRDDSIIGVLRVEDVYETNAEIEAKQVFKTTDAEHPGVKRLVAEQDNLCVGGTITLAGPIRHDSFRSYRLTPQRTRESFDSRGWKSVVAFQTRNPIHRAHEYLIKNALETIDGVMIHPLMGFTKPGDVPGDVRMACYEALIERYFVADRALLSIFPAAMRYAGPREAIWHAIARKNYGCTHFIVGRDHAGVGSYYGTYDAQKIFDRFTAEEIGITPMKFEHAFFCRRTGQMSSSRTSPSEPSERIFLSGTKVREMLSNGELPPPEFTRPEVATILMNHYRSNG